MRALISVVEERTYKIAMTAFADCTANLLQIMAHMNFVCSEIEDKPLVIFSYTAWMRGMSARFGDLR